MTIPLLTESKCWHRGGSPIFTVLLLSLSLSYFIYVGHAELTFTNSGQHLDPLAGAGVALADFNGDGFLDAFVVNQDSQLDLGHRVYFGDGHGLFADSGQRLVDPNPCGGKPVLGDINGDGRLEVIAGRTVWFNDGRGHFAGHTNWIEDSVVAGFISLELADLNGDDHLDGFVFLWDGGHQTGVSRVYLNDGLGRFRDTGQPLGKECMSGLALGDVNGDGFIDAITAGWKQGGTSYCPNRVWLNDGQGNFHDTGQLLYNGTEHIHGAALGDVNGDGTLDLLLGMNAAGRAGLIMTNDGTGRFTARQSLGGLWAQAVMLADFDGDGSLDAFLGCGMVPNGPASQVWLNDGRGTFHDSGARLANAITQHAAFGDLNADGKLDIVVANTMYQADGTGNYVASASPVQVWLNSRSMRPTITLAPTNQIALPGRQVTFHVAAWGDAPLSYQWRFNETNLTTATNSALVLTNVQLADAGSYSVVVANPVGASTSGPAALVADPKYLKLSTPAPGRMAFDSWVGCAVCAQYSGNLRDWFPLVALTNLTGTLEYLDKDATNHSSRFYRAVVSLNPEP